MTGHAGWNPSGGTAPQGGSSPFPQQHFSPQGALTYTSMKYSCVSDRETNLIIPLVRRSINSLVTPIALAQKANMASPVVVVVGHNELRAVY